KHSEVTTLACGGHGATDHIAVDNNWIGNISTTIRVKILYAKSACESVGFRFGMEYIALQRKNISWLPLHRAHKAIALFLTAALLHFHAFANVFISWIAIDVRRSVVAQTYVLVCNTRRAEPCKTQSNAERIVSKFPLIGSVKPVTGFDGIIHFIGATIHASAHTKCRGMLFGIIERVDRRQFNRARHTAFN